MWKPRHLWLNKKFYLLLSQTEENIFFFMSSKNYNFVVKKFKLNKDRQWTKINKQKTQTPVKFKVVYYPKKLLKNNDPYS